MPADVKRLDHSQPFTFTAPSKKVNWKRLRQLDVAAMTASSDAAGAMQLFEDVAHGDVEQGSIYELSEASLLKLLKLAQLQLQYMQYKLEEKVEAEQAVEDNTLAIAASDIHQGLGALHTGLASLAPPSLGDIHQGLGALAADMSQLGSSRVAGLIQQVRAEERSAAKSALLQAIQKSKQQVDVKYGTQLQQQAGGQQEP
ncbi:hypothetical protein OEZ85_000330 [Tetradesmus obliquus]|uniref:Cilium assembly protein DZIP1 N-terminal domain-containing protein n=1 Tax=Tetradesmus obliquus TaxID=3088 RepID=A0ABY8UQD7_TETOB|nr:hypothetical protein OEZ85_000330 [Tetradesmus obliquus]